MKKLLPRLIPFAAFAPLMAFAQAGANVNVRYFTDWLRVIGDFVNDLIPFVFALALLVFIWGIFRYFVAGSEEDREEGKKYMIWGILGLVVMAAVWGIVALLLNVFGFTQTTPPPVPTIPQIDR